MFLLFVREMLPTEVVALVGAGVLLALGLLPYESAVAVLSNTSWVSDFLSGQELGAGDEMAAAATAQQLETAKVAYTRDLPHGTEVTLVLPDGTTAKAVLQRDEVMASASTVPLVSSN